MMSHYSSKHIKYLREIQCLNHSIERKFPTAKSFYWTDKMSNTKEANPSPLLLWNIKIA